MMGARLPASTALRGAWMIVAHGGGRSTPSLSVKYEGPGVAKQAVPASALFHAVG